MTNFFFSEREFLVFPRCACGKSKDLLSLGKISWNQCNVCKYETVNFTEFTKTKIIRGVKFRNFYTLTMNLQVVNFCAMPYPIVKGPQIWAGTMKFCVKYSIVRLFMNILFFLSFSLSCEYSQHLTPRLRWFSFTLLNLGS